MKLEKAADRLMRCADHFVMRISDVVKHGHCLNKYNLKTKDITTAVIGRAQELDRQWDIAIQQKIDQLNKPLFAGGSKHRLWGRSYPSLFRWCGANGVSFADTLLALECLSASTVPTSMATARCHHRAGRLGRIVYGDMPSLTLDQTNQIKSALAQL